MKRIFFSKLLPLVIALITVWGMFCMPAAALDTPSEENFKGAKAVYMYNITHGVALFDYNSDIKLNTSTSAKITMGMLLCDALKDKLNEKVTVTSEMLDGVTGSCMKPNLVVGEVISIDALLYGALCGSYNDAAAVLAHIAFGDKSELVAQMNKKAAELGAANTHYTNILGYPDNSEMLTTAKDVFKISMSAYKNELYMKYASAEKYTCDKTNKSDKRYIYNRNSLVNPNSSAGYYNPDCIGMNAGYSGDNGGWSVVSAVNDESVEYIMIILGGSESEDETQIYAYEIANILANYVCNEYSYVTVYKKGQEVGMTTVGLTALNTDNAPYLAESDLRIYIPSSVDPKKDVTYKVHYINGEINAPIEAGTKIGVIEAIYNGQIIGEANLILKESYERNGVMAFIQALFEYTRSRAFVFTLIFFPVSLICAFVFLKLRSSKFDRHLRK